MTMLNSIKKNMGIITDADRIEQLEHALAEKDLVIKQLSTTTDSQEVRVSRLLKTIDNQSRELHRFRSVVKDLEDEIDRRRNAMANCEGTCNLQPEPTPAATAIREHHQACSITGYTDSDGCPNPPACHPDCQIQATALQQAKEEM